MGSYASEIKLTIGLYLFISLLHHLFFSLPDNRETMHTATPFSDQMEVRDMRRTTVFDDGPDRNGVPELAGSTPLIRSS